MPIIEERSFGKIKMNRDRWLLLVLVLILAGLAVYYFHPGGGAPLSRQKLASVVAKPSQLSHPYSDRSQHSRCSKYHHF